MKKPIKKIERVQLYADVDLSGKIVDIIEKLKQIIDEQPNAELSHEYIDYDYYFNRVYYYQVEPEEEFNKRMEKWQEWKDGRK